MGKRNVRNQMKKHKDSQKTANDRMIGGNQRNKKNEEKEEDETISRGSEG